MPSLTRFFDPSHFVLTTTGLALTAAALIACTDARAGGEGQGAVAEGGPRLAGVWRAVSETQTLELRSRIRLSPTTSPYNGTSLGGSVGYGSATTTNIATEPVPVTTRRSVELAIAADGAFRLTDTRISDPQARCPTQEVEERRGRASANGSTIVLEDAVAVSRRTANCEAPVVASLSVGRQTLGRDGAALRLGAGETAMRLQPAG